MGTPNEYIGADWAVDQIKVGARHRKDLGDLTSLMDSISEQGLLQPITVTDKGWLICGLRRLEAIKQLGWRTVHVWTRCDLSDQLSGLLAERDDNLCHKQYSKIELADLYEELKTIYTAEAAKRVRFHQFGANAEMSDGDGSANLAEPWRGSSDSRRQAAAMVGGASHMTLEKIATIRQVAADTTLPDSIREQAVEAVKAIDAGSPVDPWFRQVRSATRLHDLERIAADESEHDEAREAALSGVILMRKLDAAEMGQADLDKAASSALERVKEARRRYQPKTPSSPPPPPKPRWRTTKDFVFTWDQIHESLSSFDKTTIAAEITDDQWDQFQQALDDWCTFRDDVTTLRRTQPDQ